MIMAVYYISKFAHNNGSASKIQDRIHKSVKHNFFSYKKACGESESFPATTQLSHISKKRKTPQSPWGQAVRNSRAGFVLTCRHGMCGLSRDLPKRVASSLTNAEVPFFYFKNENSRDESRVFY